MLIHIFLISISGSKKLDKTSSLIVNTVIFTALTFVLIWSRSSTNVSGSVLYAVAVRSQARWLQQLVDAKGQALFEDHVALNYSGFVIIHHNCTLKTHTRINTINTFLMSWPLSHNSIKWNRTDLVKAEDNRVEVGLCTHIIKFCGCKWVGLTWATLIWLFCNSKGCNL